ncbi:hypothetical protein [Flavisphingomonas formosensis]|uniref:hypothetical protein n=1 Tax=Flavisphingomonas formosensis TaxID=861534 RepID=UPI0012F96A8B|nr:hypothetical protein [Sphingomonas formosensis]
MDAVVITAGRRYEIDFDIVTRRQVFVWGSVSDDSDGSAMLPPYAVSVDEPLLDASIHDLGYALAGDPDVALADTSIAHALQIGVTSDGYRPATQTITVPANPILPLVRPVALRRLPLRLTGRVINAATGAGIAGAAVALTGPVLAAPAVAVLLSSPLVANLSGGAQLQGHGIAPIASPVPIKTAHAATAGSRELVLDDLQGLSPGSLLRFGQPDRAFWTEIALLPGAPGLVRLAEPLARSVREGDPAAPFALNAAVGPLASALGAAYAGEGILIADAAPGGAILVITDPPEPPRYHGLGALTGASGDYAIDGVARLAKLRLAITASGFSGQTRMVPLPDTGRSFTLDWRLQP